MDWITKRYTGFNLIEMLVTLTLLSILALAVTPVAQLAHRRSKEQELRYALFSIRKALDDWKTAVERGDIPAALLPVSGYPPSLKALADGIQLAPTQPRRRFLRFVPRDPFFGDPTIPAELTWQLRSYASPPEAPVAGEDVYDVHSSSAEKGLNGIPYREW